MDGPSKDVHEAADEAIRRFPFIDGTRQCAMGASWGGVIVAWLHVTTTRYSCLVQLVSAFSQDVIWSNDQPDWWALMNGVPRGTPGPEPGRSRIPCAGRRR